MTRSPRTVSEKLGYWEGSDGHPRRAYRALVPLGCARCGGRIAQGEVFARRSDMLGSPQAVPHCQRCLPLWPIGSTE